MKIYTKTGDAGQTALGSGKRVSKSDPQLDAYGTVDELNSVLGLIRAESIPTKLEQSLARIQSELFDVGADLANPILDGKADGPKVIRVQSDLAQTLEIEIDAAQAELSPLKEFILPGGVRQSALLHLARTVCRRAERSSSALLDDRRCNVAIVVYLNRLSDWLFVMARLVNHLEGVKDVPWSKPAKRL